MLSYDWQTLDQDVKATEAVLAPSFRSEYAKTMAGVSDQTIKNQVKLTATAVATSIVSATDKKVVALVFVNQVTTAKGTAEPAPRPEPGAGHADPRWGRVARVQDGRVLIN